MITRTRLFLGLTLLFALALTWFRIPVASSQGLTLVATKIGGELPLTNPASELWQQATAIEAPLSAQNVARPILLETRIKSVVTRALYNDQQLALLVEWADDTQNDQTLRVQDFRDGVAVQFPLAEGQPFFCMGQQGGDVNIWHWKADWQANMFAQRAMTTTYPNMYVDQYPFTEPAANVLLANYTAPNYLPAQAAGNLLASASHTSPVEDILAGGFGSLTAQPLAEQNVQGYGVWANGRWQVIFSRDLTSAEANDASFAPDKVYSVAFAAWDGANGERNGQKSTSQWVSLQLGGAAAPAAAAAAAPAVVTTTGSTGLSWLVLVGLLAVLSVTVAFFAYYFSLPK
jgi:hypothetical protein